MPRDFRHEVKCSVIDWLGIDLTDAQADEILSDPEIRGQVEKWGIDTCTRESIGKFLAYEIVGRPWPMNRDSKEYKDAFFADYQKNAEAKGYRLLGDEGD